MNRQQQWSIPEGVILLDGLLKIIDEKETRTEVIRRVSSILRNMAISDGLKIDEKYRNENGISFQLASMESAYYGQTIMKPATKLFLQVVDLYRKDRNEFENILKGALEMTNSNNYEETFLNWLSNQVRPAQLSELYGTYKEIEKFCLRVNVISTPLFSSADYERAKKIKNTIETNKVFRFSHKKQMAKFVASATHFMHYCKMLSELNDETKNSLHGDRLECMHEMPGVDKVFANASGIDQSDNASNKITNETTGSGLNETNTYFSVLKTRAALSSERAGEVIKDWNDVQLISEKLVSKNKFRDNMLFVLLVNTGLTVETVLNLRFADFIHQDGSIKDTITIIKGKTAANSRDESGTYQLNKDVISALFLYIRSKPSYRIDDYLFMGESTNNNSFAPFSRQTVIRIFAGITEEIDNKYNISARTLKKTFDYHFNEASTKTEYDEAKSEPVKQLSDVIRIKSYLISHERYRDNLLFAVGFGLGLTIRELTQLRCSHLLDENGELRIEFPVLSCDIDNSDYECYVEIGNEIANAIELYRKNVGVADFNDYVFRSESNNNAGNALTPVSILRIIKSVIAEVGIEINATSLIFRKTFVYHQLLISGGSDQMKSVIRRALKHSSFNQTLLFLCSDEKELERNVEQNVSQQTSIQTSEETYVVDFNSVEDYSYSVPQFFSYFDEKHQDLRSWTDLYVKLFTCLYEDYPHVLKPGMNFSKSIGGRIELATEEQGIKMFAPKKIANTNLILETNISASDMIAKMRYLLELCKVDYENVEIVYSRRRPLTRHTQHNVKSSQTEVPSALSPIVDEQYKTVLKDRFVKGYRLTSGLDLKKFKKYYFEIHGKELSDDDNIIVSKIRNSGIVHEDKLFMAETMLSADVRDRLLSYIADEFAHGKKALYYEAIFRLFSDQFLDYYIYDAEMLKAYLAYCNESKYIIATNYIAKESGISSNPYDEIKEYLVGAGVPVDADSICEVLSHIPRKKVMQILGMNAEFVNNGKSHYFHVSVVSLSHEELENIATLITDFIHEKEFISGNELISAIKVKYPHIIDNNQSISALGMRDAIKYNLQTRFSFSGNVISGKGNWMSMADVFANFARSRSIFDIAELETLAEEMNSTIYFDAVYDNALRISQSRFVSKDQAQFRIEETDLAIGRFCDGKCISLAAITEFGSFPDAGFQWNSFLLASYVYAYSKQYRLLTAGFNKNASVGAIVNRNSGIETFDDFLVIALAEGDCRLKKEDALNFLVAQGYLARRSYSNIEKILIQANAQRNMKGTD